MPSTWGLVFTAHKMTLASGRYCSRKRNVPGVWPMSPMFFVAQPHCSSTVFRAICFAEADNALALRTKPVALKKVRREIIFITRATKGAAMNAAKQRDGWRHRRMEDLVLRGLAEFCQESRGVADAHGSGNASQVVRPSSK